MNSMTDCGKSDASTCTEADKAPSITCDASTNTDDVMSTSLQSIDEREKFRRSPIPDCICEDMDPEPVRKEDIADTKPVMLNF